MEIKPVKDYKVPKYPTSIEVNVNSELLREPLEKWKKVGITSALLITLISSNNISRAISIDMDNIAGGFPGPSYYSYVIGISKAKDNIKKTFFIEALEERGTISDTDIGEIIQSFLDWLFIQGLM